MAKSTIKIPAVVSADPQFKALVAALDSKEKALAAFNRIKQSEVDPRIAELVAVGFTEAQAKAALVEGEAVVAEAPAPAPKVPTTSKERGEALREKQGYGYAKGRVYGGPALAEAIVRVHKTGKPEIVESSGVGRTKAVLVYKEDGGDVAQQNLIKGA